MKKTAAALATVVITCSFFTHCVSAEEAPIPASVLHACQEQLTEKVAICKTQKDDVGCFFDALEDAEDCTHEGQLAQLQLH